MKILTTFLLAISLSFLNANPIYSNYLNDAAYVAQVKSFSLNGYLNCEFQCFLDLNYTDFENEPVVYFQLGTFENPTEFKNIKLTEGNLMEQTFHENNYKIKLDFGKIAVRKNFVVRIAVVDGPITRFINLSPTDFNNSITIMDREENLADSGLCKAEQFLRKIDFDRLYREYTFIEE